MSVLTSVKQPSAAVAVDRDDIESYIPTFDEGELRDLAAADAALDERERLHDLRASLNRAKHDIANGNFTEWSPTFMDDLTQEADELAAQGYQPKRDVYP